MRKLHLFLTAAILATAVIPAFAAPPVAPPAAAPAPAALSPAIQAALNDFSSDNFKTRQAASAKLQVALADQLRALTTSDDPEVLSRLSDLLEFNEGLTRWVIETLKLPPEQRKTQLDFGMQPEILPALAQTFSPDPDKRIEGIKALAKIDKPEIADILAPFLNDSDRAVYVAAMEAVWDKKPTDAVVDALWDRAVGDTAVTPKKQAAADANITFRGRNIGGAVFTGGFYMARRQDADLAVETLINLKAPQVQKKITAFLENYDKTANGNANGGGGNVNVAHNNVMIAGNGPNGIMVINGGGGMLFNPLGEPMKNVFKLIEAYKSKENLPILYKLATEPLRTRNQGNFNKDAWFFSNRTTPIAAVVAVIGQKPEDYNLKHLAIMNNAWAFPSQDDETAAIKKLHDWYVANVDKNAPDISDDDDNADDTPAPGAPGVAPGAPIAPMPHKLPPIAPAGPNGPIIQNRVNSRRIGPLVEPGDAPATQPANN